MNNLSQILLGFEPISLQEMEKVSLMNRVDRKFVFHAAKLPDVLQSLVLHYRVLEVNGLNTTTYQSLYFDSPDFVLYNHHHTGKLNRYKIRHRTYTESKLGFVEIKFKNNKLRTIKNRVKQSDVSVQTNEVGELIKQHAAPLLQYNLLPVLKVNHKRITLVNHQLTERLTLDFELTFEGNAQQNGYSQLVIAELKQNQQHRAYFSEVVKKMQLQEGSISKYCMGMALTHPQVKSNNFKMMLRRLEKINQTYAITNT